MWRSRPNIAVFFCDFFVGVPLKFGGFHPQTDGSVEKETNLGGSHFYDFLEGGVFKFFLVGFSNPGASPRSVKHP